MVQRQRVDGESESGDDGDDDVWCDLDFDLHAWNDQVLTDVIDSSQ